MVFTRSTGVLFTLLVAVVSSTTTLSLLYDPDTPLATTLGTYLSMNIDSGSFYDNIDLRDPILIALTTNIAHAAPTQLRVGGGVADNLLFTGVGGLGGNCTGMMQQGISTCLNADMWDALVDFSAATGVELVFDLNVALRDPTSGAWNSTNAASLFAYAAATPLSRASGLPVAWQLGNEVEDFYKRTPQLNMSGATLAESYAALRVLLTHYPALSQTVNGPDACCEERRAILTDFATAAAAASPPLVAATTVHAYPIARWANNSCIPALYLSKTAALSLLPALIDYSERAAPLVTAGIPLILGETATSAHGGCANASDAFVAGFTFLLELGAVGEIPGYVQMNRQDLVGLILASEPSNYALVGPAGWSHNGSTLTPRPDYFTALLWKHLVSPVVLTSSYTSVDDPISVTAAVDAHMWCARTGNGAAILSFTNLLGRWVNVSLPDTATTTRRIEFILTSTAIPTSSSSIPPPQVWEQSIYLNGALLTVNADGTLPVWPFPGKSISDGSLISVPPWSYGMIEVLDAGAVGACSGCATQGQCS